MIPDRIDVAIPTYESADALPAALDHLHAAETDDIQVNHLILVDNESDDGTIAAASDRASEYGWELTVYREEAALPFARSKAMGIVDTDWFLFLDDDVRISDTYLEDVTGAISQQTGAVQGRKASRTERNADWSRKRARRAGTHATLIRTEAVDGAWIPHTVTVLEDEYIRQRVEDRGYLWTFNHNARFEHESQDRHPIGWEEGYVGGRHGLSQFHTVALNIPFAAATMRNPWPHMKRAAGWLAGRAVQPVLEPDDSRGAADV